MKKLNKNKGFTLLELMVVLAIIATASLFAIPTIKEWQIRDSIENSINQIYSNLMKARFSAFTLNTTTRLNIVKNGNDYTLRLYKLATPTISCNPTAVGWSLIETNIVELNSNFTISGSGIGDICFYRDSSSNGGSFSFDETNNPTIYNVSSDIDVVLATGFIDLVRN